MKTVIGVLRSSTAKMGRGSLWTMATTRTWVSILGLPLLLLLPLVLAGVHVRAGGEKEKKLHELENALFSTRTVSPLRPASPPPPPSATTIYDSIPAPLPPNVPSLGFQADHTNEFGDLIHFAGSGRSLTQVTVVMSDFALASDYPTYPGALGPSWNHPITLNLYNVDNSGPNPAPGTPITSKTQTFAIPWRPPADPTCSSDPHGPWKASDGNCYNGIAFTITFDLTGTTVPDDIIYGVTYNTETFGYMPINSPGPYISLNLGLAQVPPTVGNNPFPDTAYYNTEKATNYADGGAGGTGTFRRDTNWSPFSVAAKFEATGCTITCPDNVTQPNDTDQCGAAVNYPDPTTSGCGNSTVSCSPGSGTFFPVGTTTVTCMNTQPPPLGPIKSPPRAVTCMSETITESTSQTITDNNSYACSSGVSYWRAFNLPGSFGITDTFDVQSIDIGIQSATSGISGKPASKVARISRSKQKGIVPKAGPGQTVTLRLYTDSGGFPGSARTQIATADYTISDQTLTIVNLPITTTVPAGSELVVEVFAANGSNSFIIGSNSDPETGPSYVSAPGCGIASPTTTDQTDHPDTHIVMNVNGCQEIVTCSFTVTVQDTQPPTITCPENQVQCNDNDQCGAVVNYPPPTASDNCSSPTTTCSPAAGSSFPTGTTTVTCMTTDAAGNQSSSCMFTVTVNDCQAPTITCPANITRGTDPNQCAAVVNYPAPTVSDNCPGVGVPTCSPASGSTFPKGTTTVSCSVKDASNNPASCSFTVTVNDTQPPSITCPANVTRPADPNQCSAVVMYSAPTVSDNCPDVGTPTCAPASGSTFPIGTTTVNCSVKDAANNMSSCSFTVTVNDTQAPTITCPANQVQCNDNNQCGAVVNYPSPTVSDNCPGATATCSPASGSLFPKGATTVTCKATDASGNQSSPCMFTVTVNDCQNPTITCPGAVTGAGSASCPISTSGTATFTVTASDNCPGVTVVCKNQSNQVVTSGQPFPVGTTTVTCTATDTSGNTASCSFTVTEFSFCLQDESNPGSVVFVNAQTGDYSFCCGGVTVATGRGVLTTRGCIGTIDHVKGDRRVHIEWDTSANTNAGAGTAIIQVSPNKTVCQITDKKMTGNTCSCASQPPTAAKE